MSEIVAHKVHDHIEAKKPGWVFSLKDFSKVSQNKPAIERALSRLSSNGEIRRLRKGLYYKPIYGRWGEVPPETKEIVKAVERSLNTRIMPSGAATANMLNLTTQVPAKTVFYTTHSPSNVQIGKHNIAFKKVSSSRLSGRGQKAGLILNAINFLGKEKVADYSTQKQIAQLIGRKEGIQLLKAAKSRSAWIRKSVEDIVALVDK